MDTAFLKFWGDFLAQAADGTRRWSDLARWMAGDFRGAPDLTALFRSAYALEAGGADDPWRTAAWRDAARRFQASWEAFLDAFQVVPRARYEALEQEKTVLEKRLADRERTIESLRLKLARCQMADGRVIEGFQQLMDIQQAQFRQVSENIERFFSSAPEQAPSTSGEED
jgi:hypothetical protein